MKSKLIWDEWNIEHIGKHKVSREEVEEVYTSKAVKRQTYFNRILILGKTKKQRLLTIVVTQEKQKEQYVIAARDMSRKERRYYYEKTKAY